jgi:hypothetical protein
LKRNNHMDQIISKARKRLYFLSQLKRASESWQERTRPIHYNVNKTNPRIPMSCIHNGLANYLNQDLELIQKKALRIILPWVSYEDALQSTGLNDSAIDETVFQTNYLKK